MRHVVAAVLAACLVAGAVVTVQPPALPVVRHLRIDHSPAPPLRSVEISQASPTVTPITAPGSGAVCSSCPPPNTGPCGACPPQPASVNINLVQVPL